MPILLLTGTDTEIGKTEVGCGLARALADRGVRVCAVKPAESGVDGDTPGPGEDGVRLARAARQTEPAAALVRLRTPVAPPEAADREGVRLSHGPWLDRIRALAEVHDVVLVEGAGGLLSPLTWEITAIDLARDLGAAAIVVAPDRLGTLNHTRLTLAALDAAGIPVAAVVFSAPATADASTGSNAPALQRLHPDLRVHRLPRVTGVDDSAAHLAALAAEVAA
ncbi:MAG: dethiobiotin synthase [Deltaproteobacteria bacterium]|nr:MAG: dethiobiotin synthase [Deltaproteobacteria bacterium]